MTPAIPLIVRTMIRQPLLARPFLSLVKRQVARWAQPIETLRRDLNLPPAKANPIFEGQHSPALVLALYSKLLGAPQRDYPLNTHITGFAFFDAHDPSVYADMMNDGNSGAPPANGTAQGETLSPELEEFLAAGEPPIVFTLGSAAVWVADDFFRESIKAAQELNRRAVLLVADARNMPQMNLPANTKAFDYAPYSELFPRASVLVHQGGIGTTGQALRSGRPMLIVPFSHDQPDNAARCVRLGVARTMKRREYKAARIARELDALLADQTYAQRAAETRRFVQNENGTNTACDLIEREFSKRQSAVSNQRKVID